MSWPTFALVAASLVSGPQRRNLRLQPGWALGRLRPPSPAELVVRVASPDNRRPPRLSRGFRPRLRAAHLDDRPRSRSRLPQ